jgi:hypothetical protein
MRYGTTSEMTKSEIAEVGRIETKITAGQRISSSERRWLSWQSGIAYLSTSPQTMCAFIRRQLTLEAVTREMLR